MQGSIHSTSTHEKLKHCCIHSSPLNGYKDYITSCRVDVNSDSQVHIAALINKGCKSSDVNNVVKEIFLCCRENNFSMPYIMYLQKKTRMTLPQGNYWTWIVCWLWALGIKYSNAFVVAIRSISCHWIATVRSLGIHHARHRFPRGLTYLLSFLPHNNLRFPPFVLIGYNSSSSKSSTVHSQSSFLTSHLGVFGGLSFTGSWPHDSRE